MADKALILDGGSAEAKKLRLSAKPRALKWIDKRPTDAMPPPPVAPVPKGKSSPISKGKATVVKKLKNPPKRGTDLSS